MGVLDEARSVLLRRCQEAGVPLEESVAVEPLTPEEAIGERVGEEFVIKRGRERVIEARFRDARGQAFTDAPSSFHGTLAEALTGPLFTSRQRAVCVAVLNAVLRALDAAEGTVHCRDEDPTRCGSELARFIEQRFGGVCVGLVGLQPAILEGLVRHFGPERVAVVDLNPDNIGCVKSGVEVWHGDRDLPRLAAACDLALITGSTVVNGTIDGILAMFQAVKKPVIFYGNTISGVAMLLGLERVCPFGR